MAEIATLNENGKLVVPTGFKLRGFPSWETYKLSACAGLMDIMGTDEYEARAPHITRWFKSLSRKSQDRYLKMKHFQMLEKCD